MKKSKIIAAVFLISAIFSKQKEQVKRDEYNKGYTPQSRQVEYIENEDDLSYDDNIETEEILAESIHKTKDTFKNSFEILKPIVKKTIESGKKTYDRYKEIELQENSQKDEAQTYKSHIEYTSLDELGRPQAQEATLHQSMMATEKRKSIRHLKPVGFINNEYRNTIKDGGYLYNRCHLIAYKLAGPESNNIKNMITGTRQLNTEMFKWEKQIIDFLNQSENNYVNYKVTPLYNGDELIARKIRLEAYGYGDDSLDFLVEIDNVQPGIYIDYQTGENWEL